MFIMMPLWHVYGKQNLSSEAYRTTPDSLHGEDPGHGEPVHGAHRDQPADAGGRPPPGSDVYLMGRLWQWWPMLELEKGQSYRLHVMSMDWQHGLSLQPVNINVQMLPGYEMV
jgi:cytochrome c oxidase subunit II